MTDQGNEQERVGKDEVAAELTLQPSVSHPVESNAKNDGSISGNICGSSPVLTNKPMWRKIYPAITTFIRRNIKTDTLALIIAAIASIAAIESAHTTRATLYIDQRAWVTADYIPGPSDITAFKSSEDPGLVHFSNHGKTPALDVRITALAMRAADGKLPNLFLQPKYSLTSQRGGFLLPPGPTHTNQPYWVDGSGPVRFKGSKLEGVKPGDTVFVYGRIDYDDVFGQQDWTTYCQRLRPAGGYFEPCESYNSMDRNKTAH